MSYFMLTLKILGGLALIFLLGVFVVRFSKPELTWVYCGLFNSNRVCDRPEDDTAPVDVQALVLAIQDGLAQVQSKNLGTGRPEMFFIDDLSLKLSFLLERTGTAEIKLIVVPSGVALGEKESRIQKLTLNFSTILDKGTREYLADACKAKVSYDPSVTLYCGLFTPGKTADSGRVPDTPLPSADISIDTDKLNIDWSQFLKDYKFEGMGVDGSADSGEVASFCGKNFELCSDTPVTGYTVDGTSGLVKSFEIKPLAGNSDVTDWKNAMKGWDFSKTFDGGFVVSPPPSK